MLLDKRWRAERARKREAADWFARMRGPDASRAELEFERWRASGPGNRAAYERLEALWRVSAGLAATRIGREPVFIRRQPIFAARGPRLAFASIAVVLAAGTGALFLSQRGGAPMVDGAAAAITTRVGEIRVVRLADGTTVTLDTDSEVEVAISSSARVVRLTRGRARFDVAHDAATPFTVQADGKTVTARGTLFDVAYCREGVRVTLLRGLVDVAEVALAAGGPAAETRLTSGQTLSAATGGTPRIVAAAVGGDQWVSGMLSFDGAPLSSVIDEANRYASNKLRLGNPELASLRVTGVFKALPTEVLAASLAAAFDLRIERAANGDFVLHARRTR